MKFVGFKKRFLKLLRQPFFWALTVGGNIIVVVGAFLLRIFENISSTNNLDFMDYLLWSMGIVTTIGYGSYVPMTFAGKWIVFLLMACGTLFTWSYMAFLVTALLAPELAALERDVHDVEKELKGVRHESR